MIGSACPATSSWTFFLDLHFSHSSALLFFFSFFLCSVFFLHYTTHILEFVCILETWKKEATILFRMTHRKCCMRFFCLVSLLCQIFRLFSYIFFSVEICFFVLFVLQPLILHFVCTTIFIFALIIFFPQQDDCHCVYVYMRKRKIECTLHLFTISNWFYNSLAKLILISISWAIKYLSFECKW